MKLPKDFPVQPLRANQKAKDRVTCGTCGRSWDDAIPTSWTPAPSARCPFEYFHDEVKPTKKRIQHKKDPLHDEILEVLLNSQACLGDRVRDESATDSEIETYEMVKAAIKKMEVK